MTCTSCNKPSLSVDLFNGLCLQCTGLKYDRLKTSCQHLISNWRSSTKEIEEKFQPSNPGQTQIAVTALEECANRLEDIVNQASLCQ